MSVLGNDYLHSSRHQFGFKKGVSCSHAIFTLRKTIDYVTNNNSTVNICALDISKAFDSLNNSKLFLKLMERNVPRDILFILFNWYSKIFVCVKWANEMSIFVQLKAGVRQGVSYLPISF